jgi:hypothetical protein
MEFGEERLDDISSFVPRCTSECFNSTERLFFAMKITRRYSFAYLAILPHGDYLDLVRLPSSRCGAEQGPPSPPPLLDHAANFPRS